MKYYKLTNQKMQTFKGFQWELNVWKKAIGDIDMPLCTNSWLHCYDSPLLAVLHNPIHADISDPRLFEAEVRGETKNDRGLKRGFREMQLVKEVEVPQITKTQVIAYGILCAQKVYDETRWNIWAKNWLDKTDRTAAAAAYAAAAYAAAAAAAAAGVYAAAAVPAAEAAAYAAADAAAYAAYAEAADAAHIDFIKVAQAAMKY